MINISSLIFFSLKKVLFLIVNVQKTFLLPCSAQTQREGLIFIYDMTNSSYGNFDYELCVKILNLLKVSPVYFFNSVGFGFFDRLFFPTVTVFA